MLKPRLRGSFFFREGGGGLGGGRVQVGASSRLGASKEIMTYPM